jgi:putative addiction module component (TIGR02574 family)
MNPSAAEVLEAALELPEDQRATVAEKLLASLDGEVDADAESEWAAEIERRLERMEAGQAKSVSMDESLMRLQRIGRDAG